MKIRVIRSGAGLGVHVVFECQQKPDNDLLCRLGKWMWDKGQNTDESPLVLSTGNGSIGLILVSMGDLPLPDEFKTIPDRSWVIARFFASAGAELPDADERRINGLSSDAIRSAIENMMGKQVGVCAARYAPLSPEVMPASLRKAIAEAN